MPMMTGDQNEASLRRLNLVVYLLGKRIKRFTHVQRSLDDFAKKSLIG